jgi:hypothetical protein
MRAGVVYAEEGQDSFPWPRTRDAASLQLLVGGGGGGEMRSGESAAVVRVASGSNETAKEPDIDRRSAAWKRFAEADGARPRSQKIV